MKITRAVMVVLTALLLTIVVVGIAAAAPSDWVQDARTMPDQMAAPVPTTTLPITQTITHPVGLAISLYFHIPYTQVMGLHASGIGFGVIARAYLTAQASNGALTPEQVLALHQGGMGWGEIAKQYGVRPGGHGLGSIMSGHANQGGTTSGSMGPSGSPGSGSTNCPGNSCNAPGHNKPGKGPKK